MIRTTLAQAQQFILAKNCLAGEKAGQLAELVQRLVGLPGEPLTTPFLAARARLNKFTPAQLLDALYQERYLIKSPLMHNTPYIVPTGQYPSLLAATNRQRNQAFNAEFRLWGLETNEEIEALGQAVLAAMAGQPATMAELAGRLEPGLVRELSQTSRGGRVTTTTTIALALRWLASRGEVTVSNASLDWQQEAPVYTRLRQGYPGLEIENPPAEAEAQKALARAYLAVFGPATEADLSFWTGFGKSETARATGLLSSETTLALVEGIPGMLLLLKSQAEALQNTSPAAQPIVNALPADDPFTTAHRASRSRYFSDQKLQRQVFSNTGAAKPTLMVNGQIAGVWEWQPNGDQHQLSWRLLAPVDPAIIPSIEAELAAVAAFIGPEVSVIRDE